MDVVLWLVIAPLAAAVGWLLERALAAWDL